MPSFTSFEQSFKGEICTSADAGYAKAIGRWALNAQANAQIVAFVKTPEDVALAIAYARENRLPVAIHSGGHNTAGASSTEGLVIDLSRHLNTVEIDTENKLAYVGGGAIWGQVDRAAIQHGLASVAGTVNHVGVGGLTLGGGMGVLSGEHGLVIDNLIKVIIVSADGCILTASETENPSLFWGIRGGGCNFGVVTQFVFKLYPQRRTVFSGNIIYPADALEQVIDAIDTWWSTVGPKETLKLILTSAPDTPTTPVVIVSLFYNGSEAEGRVKFKSFLDLEHIADLTKEIPYEEVNQAENDQLNHGQCRVIKGLAMMTPHFRSSKKVLNHIVSLADTEMRATISLDFFPFKKIQSIPNGTCALQRPKFNYGIALMTWKNNTPENRELAQNLAQQFASIVASGQREYLGKVEQGYGNYDHSIPEEEDGDDKAKSLFRENYPRLQELKKKYDPMNVFNKWFPITPSS